MSARSWRLPAEWEPHAATWIAWPHQRGDWPGKFAPIPWVYTEIVRHLSRSENVNILVNTAPVRRRVSEQIEVGGSVFNLLNAGDYTQYNYSGANEQFNTANYLQLRNQQAARGFQATLVFRF